MRPPLLLGLLLLITLSTGAAECWAGLAASWNFDDCTAHDASGNGMNGAINGSSSCVTGLAGKALRFSGNGGYVEVPDDPRLSPLTSLTVEASIKPESLDNPFNGVIYKEDGSGGGYSLVLYGGGLGLIFSISFESEQNSQYLFQESDLVPLGQWSRIKVEVDAVAGKVRIFVNGILKSEQECPRSNMVADRGPLRIGAADLSLAQYGFHSNLNGLIDEVRISTNNPLLTTSLTGTGRGSLNSIPNGLACSSASCSTYLATPDPITLVATPDSDSFFGGWSGACTNSTGNCTVIMNANREVGAIFSSNLPVKLTGTPERHFRDLSAAYGAVSGAAATLLAKAVYLAGDAILDRPVTVSVRGGYDNTFGAAPGRTVLTGRLLVRRGTLRANRLGITSSSSPIASSTPADAATRVAVATPIAVRLHRGIDAATVNQASLKLVGKWLFGSFTVPGGVSYDATQKTIRLKTGGLPAGCSYTLTLSGLKDLSGIPLPDTTVKFSTARNELVRSVGYQADGSLRDYAVTELLADGRPDRVKGYPSPGPDGVWSNSDDLLGANDRNSYYYDSASGKQLLDYVYSYFGDSGFFTRRWFYDGAGELLTRESHYGLSDLGYTSFDYASQGYLREATRKGPSGNLLSYTETAYDSQGNKVQEVSYNCRNPDGTPLANPVVARYLSYQRDAAGVVSRVVSYEGDGPDGLWFTPDDEVSGYWDLSYSIQGPLQRAIYHGDPGGDGTWFNGDDLLLAYLDHHYDAGGNRSETRRFTAPGADGTWFTADDTKSRINSYDTSF